MDTDTQIPTKAALLALPEIGTEVELARLTGGISRAAVNQWPRDKPIPERRWLILRYQTKPELFQESDAA